MPMNLNKFINSDQHQASLNLFANVEHNDGHAGAHMSDLVRAK